MHFSFNLLYFSGVGIGEGGDLGKQIEEFVKYEFLYLYVFIWLTFS